MISIPRVKTPRASQPKPQYPIGMEIRIEVPARKQAQLERLQELFLATNEQLNLSALRTPEQCWNGNVLDSLSALSIPNLIPKKDPGKTPRLLDIGTGSGFPVFPLAICFPELQCFGIDSVGKKMKALEQIRQTMQVKNLTLITGRSEELAHHAWHREKCDIVTARAVAPLPTLIEFCSPFLLAGGIFVCWKSMQIDEELRSAAKAMQELHCTLETQYTYKIDDVWGQRQLLVFRKTAPVASTYPRAVGVPKKEPLL